MHALRDWLVTAPAAWQVDSLSKATVVRWRWHAVYKLYVPDSRALHYVVVGWGCRHRSSIFALFGGWSRKSHSQRISQLSLSATRLDIWLSRDASHTADPVASHGNDHGQCLRVSTSCLWDTRVIQILGRCNSAGLSVRMAVVFEAQQRHVAIKQFI